MSDPHKPVFEVYSLVFEAVPRRLDVGSPRGRDDTLLSFVAKGTNHIKAGSRPLRLISCRTRPAN